MFILMMAIIGIGFLMKFVLISGQERWIKYGRNVEETVLGLDRHGWGKVHLIIGLILFAALILHLILHWGSITRFFKNAFASKAHRISFVSVILLLGASLIICPFFVNTQVTDLEAGNGRLFREESNTIRNTSISRETDDDTSKEEGLKIVTEAASGLEEDHQLKRVQREELKAVIEVMGYMTLSEVSQKYNVQADLIKERIGIPLSTSNSERLGQLRRRYRFTMIDVRDAVDAERNK
jgi:hypothetical protein